MKHWLTTKQVAELTGLTERGIRKKVQNKEYDLTREVSGMGRGGKSVEIHLSSLKPEHQQAYREQHADDDQAQATLLNPLDHPQWAIDEMRRRVAILREWDILLAQTPRKQKSKIKAEFCAAKEMHFTVLYRWEQALRERGEAGLMPNYPRERKAQQVLTSEIKGVIRQWWLTPNRRYVKTVWEMLGEYCQQNGLICPSYNTVAAFCRDLSESEKCLYREGTAAWRSKHEPIARRNAEELGTNELWCGDHRQLDILCKHPIRVQTRGGVKTVWKVAAPWLTLWLDIHSWCFVGWHLAWQPNSQTIALALRDGILTFGVPESIYVDCGKDYRSMYLANKQLHNSKLGKILPSADLRTFADMNGLNINPEGILDALGIEKRHAIAVDKKDAFRGGVPRAKPIEGAFNWFTRMEREFPGWRTNDGKNMPETTRKLISGAVNDKTPLPFFEDIERAIAESIREHNARPHGEREKAAIAYYDDPAIVRLPESQRDALNILLWPSKPVTVASSEVYLNNIPYMSPELAKWGGEKVIVRWDPKNVERVVVMTTGRPSSVICVAENQKMRNVSWHPTEEEYREYVVKPKKQAKKAIDGMADAYETLSMDDGELLKKGRKQRRDDDRADLPPLPPKPRGGKPKPKPEERPAGLQNDGKTYMLSEFRERKASAAASASGEIPQIDDISTGAMTGSTAPAKIEKVLPRVYHEAAEAVQKADRQDEVKQDVRKAGRMKYVGGRWVANG